jgi:hypothetical protein
MLGYDEERNMKFRNHFVALFAIVTTFVSADPSAPYGFNCLKDLTLWEQVEGQWSLTNGVFAHESSTNGVLAVLTEKATKIPGWYDVTLSATGLKATPSPSISIVFGYTDKTNYWLCTYEEIKEKPRVSIRRIEKGVSREIAESPVNRVISDTVTIQVQMQHFDTTSIVAMVDHYRIVNYTHNGKLPRRFGVMLPGASNVSIDKVELSGIAKR